jgi:hypothetical protein
MPARWAAILVICACGCKGGPPKLDPAELAPYRPEPAACGELAGLPGRPLLAVTRRQCLASALANGRAGGENFRNRIAAVFRSLPSAAGTDRSVSPPAVEPPLELLRTCEELVAAVDAEYWALRTAYATYLCKAAAAETARELEAVAEKLVEAGRQTRADLEKARQARIGYEMERETALHGTDPPGLLEAEARLRHTIGYSDHVPGLLLPADPLPVVDPAFDCAARLEYARDHRLELVTARYRIIAARGRAAAAEKPEERDAAARKQELATAYSAQWEQRAAMDIQAALDRVGAAARAGGLIAERRASVARQLADFERLANEDAIHRAELIEARIRVLTATAEEHQAVGTYLTAVTELDRVTGALLNRDGVKVPSAKAAGPPRPRLDDEAPPPPGAAPLRGPVRARPEGLAAGDPFAPLPAWLEPLAKP